MILRLSDRFRACIPHACPVFLLPALFLVGCLLGSVLASVLVAVLTPGTVTPGVSLTGWTPPLVPRDFPGAPVVVQVGRYAD